MLISVPFAVLVSLCLRPLLQLLLLHGHNMICSDYILMEDDTIKAKA
jgi:hypothetical protein